MINSIYIDGYKCLRDVEIETGLLNVFVGANASGKSSVLQALLLLRQSAENNGVINQLHLSGHLYEAGTAKDALHPAAEHTIVFGLNSNEGDLKLIFKVDRSDDQSRDSRRINSNADQVLPHALFGKDDCFSYLNAERIGPRVLYSLPPDEAHLSGVIGKYGEYTASILARAKANNKKVEGWNQDLIARVASGPKLLDNIEIMENLVNSGGRLDLVCNQLFSWILPGSEFIVEEFSDSDIASMRFIRDPSTKTDVRATHVGFGLVYTLPIITAAFSIRQDGILIVENPEAHLHPYSQSRMGVFLGLLASTGRQIFIETHSDHVINGIRLAVKNGLIDSGSVKINFIEKKIGDDTSKVTQIDTNKNARLSPWPEGFFDQIEQDLSRL